MADEKRTVRTAGVAGTFVLPGLLQTDEGPADLVITPEGTEITREQWDAVAEAAVQNHVIVRLDENFPVAGVGDEAPKIVEEPPPSDAGEGKEQVQTEDPATADSGPVPPSPTGTSRKGR